MVPPLTPHPPRQHIAAGTDIELAALAANRSYFHLKMEGSIDNPDQRIAEDIASFTGNTVSVVIILVGKLLNLAAFSRVLW